MESGTPQELSDRAKGQETVYMSVRGPLADIREKIEKMEHVIDVQTPEEEEDEIAGNGIHRLIVSVEKGKDIKEDLFKCVVKNKWVLSELRSEGVTLEDVFKQLTTQEDTL